MDQTGSDRLELNLQPDKARLAFGADAAQKDDLLSRLDRDSVISDMKSVFEDWEPNLEHVSHFGAPDMRTSV